MKAVHYRRFVWKIFFNKQTTTKKKDWSVPSNSNYILPRAVGKSTMFFWIDFCSKLYIIQIWGCIRDLHDSAISGLWAYFHSQYLGQAWSPLFLSRARFEALLFTLRAGPNLLFLYRAGTGFIHIHHGLKLSIPANMKITVLVWLGPFKG